MAKSKNGRLNQTDCADYCGTTKQVFNDWVRDGVVVMDGDGLIDPAAAKRMIAANKKQVQRSGVDNSKTGGIDYNTAKTMRELTEAKIANIRLREMEGALVKREIVDRAAFDIMRALRDSLINVSRRVSVDVAALSNAAECEKIISTEIKIALSKITSDIDARL
mgnify:CR=1 FL=1|tara:strand:+ start:1295 stop:1786 length:492 start_codon:yes stop_codon:yes gene_type:complete